MKLKHSIIIAIFAFIFLAGTILMLGYVSSSALPYLYFVFIFVLLLIFVFSFRQSSRKKSSALFAIIIILFIAFSLTAFVSEVKIYSDLYQSAINSNQDTINQINTLSDQIDYDLNYITYLKDEIDKTQSSSQKLQQQINQIIAQQEQPPIPTTIEREEEHEEEEDD